MQEPIDAEAFEFAIAQIDSGVVFEEFCQQFASQVIGYEFEPSGGVHDRGIDALRNVFSRKGFPRWVYQASIEKDSRSKIMRTGDVLDANHVAYEQLSYLTNQVVKDRDRVQDEYLERFRKPLRILDRKWFASNCNHSVGTQNAFQIFVSRHLHKYNRPGSGYEVSDLVRDPRLYVFLRQQWESSKGDDLAAILADTLILFALEGTDPDTGKLKNREEILAEIRTLINFESKSILDLVDSRLLVLSRKPRKIRLYAEQGAYCLPYETRREIQSRNLKDAALHEAFRQQSRARLETFLDPARTRGGLELLEKILHRLFYQQGLEFSGFVLNGENRDAIEKNLGEVISTVVEDNSVDPAQREGVKAALHIAIRDMVYNGTHEQKQFLGRLSHTYMMLFLLRVDPKVATFFQKMAGELRVYVDNSIIIPALSEYFLAPENKRYWNLLKRARAAGVQLLIERRIVDELVHHFRMIKNAYETRYQSSEESYVQDEVMTLYIDEIMIRAYFYSRQRGLISNFTEFIDKFVDPEVGRGAADELTAWLKEEFGMRYVSDVKFGEHVSAKDFDALYDALRKHKSHAEKARTDASLALTVYNERLKRNERADLGMLGYKTWWLSNDVLTQRSVTEAFGNRFETSCYIRPDFLHNYIALAPTSQEVRDTYQALFPSLIGVNISYHIPLDVIAVVQRRVKEHSQTNRARMVAVLKELADKLKSDPAFGNRRQVKLFLDERLEEYSSSDSPH